MKTTRMFRAALAAAALTLAALSAGAHPAGAASRWVTECNKRGGTAVKNVPGVLCMGPGGHKIF